MSVRKFEGSTHAQIYAKFRPTYPDSVIEEVLKFVSEKIAVNERQISVDVGCGSGQGTSKLAKYFTKCYGFDVSPAQVNEAKENNRFHNVFYDVSASENLVNINSNSVQLVTAFAAAHWFDLPEFFKEVDRMLVHNGVVALICYLMPGPDLINPDDPDDKSLTKLMSDIWFDERLAPFKSQNIVLVENRYKDVKFPDSYELLFKDNLIESKMIQAQDLLGFYQSWSLYQGLVAENAQLAEHCLQEFTDKVKAILNTNDLNEKQLIVNFKYFIAMARK